MLNDWERWNYDDRVVYSHFGGVVNCNWKVAGEAFIEGFHSLATHPQMMEWLGDENTQYDVIKGENWSRQIVPQGVPSPTIANHISEQEVLDSYYETRAFYTQGKGRDLAVGDDGTPRVPSDSTARRELAAAMRSALAEQFGNDQDHWTDSELLDGIQYFVFPNFYVFAGPRTNAIYRFRPLGNDPDKCIAEVFLLAQQPADGTPPEAAGAALAAAGGDVLRHQGDRPPRPGLRPGHGEHAVHPGGAEVDADPGRAAGPVPGEPDPALPPDPGRVAGEVELDLSPGRSAGRS